MSAGYFGAIIDCVGDPIFAKDRHYKFVFVNDAACEMFGRPREQVLGKTDYEFFPKEQADVFRRHDDAVFETGEADVNEEQITYAQGDVRTIITKKTLYVDKAGEKYIVGAIRDITERKRAEDALLESEVNYRTVVESSIVGVYIVQNGLLRFVNRRFCEIYGYTYDEMIDKVSPLDLTYPEDRPLVEENFRKRLSGETEHMEYEMRALRKDGKVITVKVLGSFMVYKGHPAVSGTAMDITEPKRAEEALLESEAKYRTVVESSLVGVYIIQDGLLRFVNRRWCEIYGYTYDEIIDKVSPLDLTPPEDRKLVEENFRKRLSGEVDHLEYEVRALRKDGEIITIKILGSFMAHKGRPAVSGTVIDITESRRAEEALRASRLQLSEAMDLAHIVYWEVDPVASTFVFNDPFYAFYGTTAEQEGGYRMTRDEYAQRFIHPEDRPLFYQFVNQSTSTPGQESVSDLEHRIIRRDGEVRYILARARILKDDSGRIVKRYGANQDITERKRMEKAARESGEQFRKMFEGSPFGMVMAGADFRFIRANAAFCRMVGYTEEELAALTFKDITHPEHIAVDARGVNDLLGGKIPLYRTEKRYVRKDKGVVWGSSTISIMRGGDGRFLYFLSTIEDITQRKQSEEERTRLELQLRQAQKMEAVGTLAGGIAHDFNNILTVIAGYGTLLKMEMGQNNPLQTYVGHVLSSAEQATHLTQGLLAFSRQQPVLLTPINVNESLRSVEKLLKRLLTEDIAIKTLPAAEDITIMADATQIHQILFNLAANARDAMPHGGTLTIETKSVEVGDEFRRLHGYGEPGRYARLSVSDTGVGMDEATRERIFDPFFTTKEPGKGTGLGLSTVYGIVRQHNGHITVYSEPNIGTTFHIYLPAVSEVDKKEEPAPPPVKGGSETILVAEDNATVRGLLSKILTEYGYATVEAIDGADAIEQFKKADRIDLLILDSVMPKKNGREAYDEIRKITPDIRVIFTSGYTRDVFLDKGIEDKKFNFLQKPISLPVLLQKVRAVLDAGQDSR